MEYFSDPLNQQRFMRRIGHRVSDDDHWIWASMVFKRSSAVGVPFLWVKVSPGGQKQVYARRFAYEMELGRKIDTDMNVVNVCGEKLCVKPHEKHNIAVRRGSWNTKNDKREYQQRMGIVAIGHEPTYTRIPGGFAVSEKLLPDNLDDLLGIPTEEEVLNGTLKK